MTIRREMLDNTKLSHEGTIPFEVYGDTFDTWYKIFGDISTATKPPLVILHGGPGISHDYLIPFKDLATPDRPVIFYDQLGTGYSTHAVDKPASFWKIDLLLDELENLLSHFKIQDNFDIVGHSWGGMMACEFIIRRSPPGLKHLVLTNSLAVMASWAKSNVEILKDYPQWVQDGMKVGYADIPPLREAAKVVFADHSCRLKPQPPELWYALDQSLENTHVYTSFSSGELKDWSIEKDLHKINVPTLVVNSRYDFANDFVVAPFINRIPEVKWVRFEESSHTPFWEERVRYMELVESFLGY